MNNLLRPILLFSLAVASLCLPGSASGREPIDKTAYQGSCWVQANPWFVPAKSRLIAPLGGPNYAMKRFYDRDGWLGAIRQLHHYGVTGIEFELVGDAYWETYLELLEAARASETGFQVSIFETLPGNSPKEIREGLTQMFDRLNPVLREHPNAARIDGRPVIIIYQVALLAPEAWTPLLDELEATYGPAVWLFVSFDGASLNTDPEVLRSYLEVFDGISNYCNFSDAGQRAHYAMVGPVMREYPEKIFEAGIHNVYMSHFHNGGHEMNLSGKFRASLDISLACQPDSLTLTNLFDHYENSLFLPCYEREDFLLRYTGLRLAQQKNEPVTATEPEYFVVTDINLRLGEDLALDLVYWPVNHPVATAEAEVSWCAVDGRVLHTFPARSLDLREGGCERFSLPSPLWGKEMAITPQVTLRWNGSEQIFAPHTTTAIQPTMRSNNMYWARSNRNQLKVAALDQPEWTLNGAGPGAKIAWNDGLGVFRGMVAAVANQNVDQIRIMRNGREFATLAKGDLMFEHALQLPSPGATWDAYHLELENRDGFRYQTLPVFVTTEPERDCDVAIPVFRSDGTIAEVRVDQRRLADFTYPMDRDDGVLLIDRSGYQHHGYLGGGGYGGGHLKFTGYHFEHSGTVEPLPVPAQPLFARDPDGTGYLAFDGAQHVSMMAATIPPYALTVELELRPRAVGAEQTILAAGNRQLRLYLDSEGRLHASRLGQIGADETVADVAGKTPLQQGQWHRIKVCYDLRQLRLYVDGELQGSVKLAPLPGSVWHNFALLGCGISGFWDPAQHFTGDLRNLTLQSR